MSFIGNILWIIFGGFFSFLGYWIGGLFLCLTIVGIPMGIQCFRIGTAVLTPFGKEIESIHKEGSILGMIFDILWLLLFGWEIAVAHLVSAAACAITIIGIPFALQHLKLVPVALFPFGTELR